MTWHPDLPPHLRPVADHDVIVDMPFDLPGLPGGSDAAEAEALLPRHTNLIGLDETLHYARTHTVEEIIAHWHALVAEAIETGFFEQQQS